MKWIPLAILIVAVGLGAARVFLSENATGQLKGKPNVVVLLLDTLRADHLGVYGYERNTSPNLDRFARDNQLFNFAVPSAPWTPPSVASILTGLYVSSHGMLPPQTRKKARESDAHLAAELKTLPEIFKENGYLTAGVSSNPWINTEFGFNQGFDTFEYSPRAIAEEVNRIAFGLLDQFNQLGGTPFFLYLHYLDPHTTYEPPGEYRKMFSGRLNRGSYSDQIMKEINLYDGEIRYLDHHLGQLFDRFKKLQLYDDLVVVIVGDHGEQFMEHGFSGHGLQLYNTETHVPLMVKIPGMASREHNETVSTIDIFPTLLTLIGLKPANISQAVSLFDDVGQRARAGVLTEIKRKFALQGFVSREGKKLIIEGLSKPSDDASGRPQTQVVGVFDSRRDYLEQKPIEDSQLLAVMQQQMNAALEAARANRTEFRQSAPTVSEETLNQIETLGYF